MKKFNLEIILGLVLVVLSTRIVFANTYSDLNQSHWAYKNVDNLSNKGILSGFPDGTFKPDEKVTREQFAKVLVESLKLEYKENSVVFEDIESSRWSKNYIDTAKTYLTGYKSNDKYYFYQESPAVREDMAVAVVKARNLQDKTPNYNLLEKFGDKDNISENLRKYIAIAVEYGIMQGDGYNFNPQDTLTRAEMATLMCNVLEKVVIDDENENGEEKEKDYYGYITIDWKEVNENTIYTLTDNSMIRIHTNYESNNKCIEYQYDTQNIVFDYKGELIPVPDTFKDGLEHILKIRVVLEDGTKTDWKKYNLIKTNINTENYYAYITVDWKKEKQGSEYILNENSNVRIYTNYNSAKQCIEYKFDYLTDPIPDYNGELISIPTSFKDKEIHTIYMRVVLDDGTKTEWIAYSMKTNYIEEQPKPDTDTIQGKLEQLGIMGKNQNHLIKRSDMVKMLVRSAGLEAGVKFYNSNTPNAFLDVSSQLNPELNGYLVIAKGRGWLIKEIQTEFFKPDEDMTYAEALVWVVRELGYGDIVESKNEVWPANYSAKASELGLTKNISYNKGDESISKTDCAQLIWNMLNTVPQENTYSYSNYYNKTMLEMHFFNVFLY